MMAMDDFAFLKIFFMMIEVKPDKTGRNSDEAGSFLQQDLLLIRQFPDFYFQEIQLQLY